MTANQKAFLDMLAFSEIGPELLAVSDNGYNVLVGSTPAHPQLFNSYHDHPNILNHALNSTAAGRYQIIHRTFKDLCNQYGLSGFTPDIQDRMALELIIERKALQDIESGNLAAAIEKCSFEWASLPGSTSGQHENKFTALKQAYLDAGGTLDEQVLS